MLSVDVRVTTSAYAYLLSVHPLGDIWRPSHKCCVGHSRRWYRYGWVALARDGWRLARGMLNAGSVDQTRFGRVGRVHRFQTRPVTASVASRKCGKQKQKTAAAERARSAWSAGTSVQFQHHFDRIIGYTFNYERALQFGYLVQGPFPLLKVRSTWAGVARMLEMQDGNRLTVTVT